MKNKLSYQTAGVLFVIFFLLFLDLKAYAHEKTSDNTFEVIESSTLFDHKEHEAYEYTCHECHNANINSCIDCHDFEEGHADLELSLSEDQIERPKSCLKCHSTEQYGTTYDLVSGPLAWFAFLVFFIGMIVRSVLYVKGLDSRIDGISYGVNTSYGIKTAVKSVFYWLLPFGSRSWRIHPLMTILTFIFHISLLLTPFFLLAHNIILKERWGIWLFTIPESTADLLTIAVIVCALVLLLRRIVLKEVRIITKASDYLVLIIAVAPFVTGLFAFHQASNYQLWLIAHIISSEIMLIAVPFTKLSHCFLFFFTRVQLGMDYGIKRGGMKGKGKAW